MSRRNPMNERYGKHTAPEGKTRKSAASAKPKRSAGKGGASKPAAKKTATPTIFHPPTPEYRRMRTIWWVLIGLGIVIVATSWWAMRTPAYEKYWVPLLIASYACIGASLWVDYAKLRVMRYEWLESERKSSKKSDNKS